MNRTSFRSQRRHDAFRWSFYSQKPFHNDAQRARAVAKAHGEADAAADLFDKIETALAETALSARVHFTMAGVPDHVVEDIIDAVHAAASSAIRRAGA